MVYGPKARVRYSAKLLKLFPSWVKGFTFGHTIFVRQAAPASPGLLAHEYRHVMQYERMGIVAFLWYYLRESMKHGYAANAYEVDARFWGGANRDAFFWVAQFGPRRLQAAINEVTGEVIAVVSGNNVIN